MDIVILLTVWMVVGLLIFVIYEKRQEKCRRIQG
jgi:hypothetical protein